MYIYFLLLFLFWKMCHIFTLSFEINLTIKINNINPGYVSKFFKTEKSYNERHASISTLELYHGI